MARFLVAIAILALALVTAGFSQSGAEIPQGGAGHADKASCIILKRMGPADQVTSRLYSFGIRGKQFQYVEGKLPDGFPFHGRLTDHDVRNLQDRGAEVVVLNQDFTAEDLKQGRADCRAETGKTPMQADDPAKSSQTQPASAVSSVATSAVGATELSVSSAPSGADIEVDAKFVGSTPSSITLAPGDHKIAVKKSGFTPWSRDISTSGGHVTINAELEEVPHPATAATTIPATVQTQPVTRVSGSATASVVPVAAAPLSASGSSSVSNVQSQLASVSVTSDPDDADIFIDSRGIGRTPKQVQIQPGVHSILVVKSGFKDWTTKVNVENGAAANVTAKLKK